jgi:hypothetical protein
VVECICIGNNKLESMTYTSSFLPFLVHLANELVDVVFPVTEIPSLDIMLEFSLSPATSRIGQFEWPEEIGCLSNTHKIQTRA